MTEEEFEIDQLAFHVGSCTSVQRMWHKDIVDKLREFKEKVLRDAMKVALSHGEEDAYFGGSAVIAGKEIAAKIEKLIPKRESRNLDQ